MSSQLKYAKYFLYGSLALLVVGSGFAAAYFLSNSPDSHVWWRNTALVSLVASAAAFFIHRYYAKEGCALLGPDACSNPACGLEKGNCEYKSAKALLYETSPPKAFTPPPQIQPVY